MDEPSDGEVTDELNGSIQAWNCETVKAIKKLFRPYLHRQPAAKGDGVDRLVEAAQAVIDKAHLNLEEKPVPQRWACPWEELNALSNAVSTIRQHLTPPPADEATHAE